MEETEGETFVVTCSGLNGSLALEIVSLFLNGVAYGVDCIVLLCCTAFSACQWYRSFQLVISLMLLVLQ